jgi:hypothetical protein
MRSGLNSGSLAFLTLKVRRLRVVESEMLKRMFGPKCEEVAGELKTLCDIHEKMKMMALTRVLSGVTVSVSSQREAEFYFKTKCFFVCSFWLSVK